VDFVVIGCPHASIREIEVFKDLLDNKKVAVETWIMTSRQVKELSDEMGFTKSLEEAGVTIICDTCPILAPTLKRGYKSVVTNSGKLAHYIRGLWTVKSRLAQIEDCAKAAIEGRLE
jgi:predicted aconitase